MGNCLPIFLEWFDNNKGIIKNISQVKMNLDTFFWEIHFCICSLLKDKNARVNYTQDKFLDPRKQVFLNRSRTLECLCRTPWILEIRCTSGTQTAFRSRHWDWPWGCISTMGKVVVWWHRLQQTAWSMWAHGTSGGTAWVWDEKRRSTKYYCWSHANCGFVFERLSRDTQRGAKTCGVMNALRCQVRLSLVEHADLCYLHAPRFISN